MKVLSLFDGISCGQLALRQADIPVETYYASEIDASAIAVTRNNFPNTIQLGDITKIDTSKLPKIDLLIGGSPCQGFSFSGKGLNFTDPRSKLFFEYVRILNEIKPTYFLLENVVMKQEFQDIISEYLGVQPIKINSGLVSAQNRVRLYWTNIPNIAIPDDRNIHLKDILMCKSNKVGAIRGRYLNGRYGGTTQVLETRKDNKSNTLTTVQKDNVVITSTGYRKLDVNEAELLQTLPIDYTRGIPSNKRFACIGNGWTVDIISHILGEAYGS